MKKEREKDSIQKAIEEIVNYICLRLLGAAVIVYAIAFVLIWWK